MKNIHSMSSSRPGILFIGLLVLSCMNAFSQEPIPVIRVNTGIITFDGIPDEQAWLQAQPLKMTMNQPVFGNEPLEKSVIRIVFDDEFLYISGILNYQDPGKMRAVSKKRDYATLSSDWLGVILDTYHDGQNAMTFWTNPNGARTDAAVKNDMTSFMNDVNFTWNTFWDSKVIMTAEGWTTEVRIPFSSLRFQVKEGKTLMGLIINRWSAGTAEMSTSPAITPEFENAFWKPSLAQIISFEGLKQKNPLYLTPYVTTGLSQENLLNDAGTGYNMKSTPKFDAGLDAKYSLTNNLTLDVTVNTDFAQVEADDQKINLTRYSLFFPEKRVFFQEKADVFDFAFMDGDNLFYSRKIGINDGMPERIFGGLRLTGKVNKWDLGILDMQTAGNENHPGENYGVIRAKRTLFNQNSYIGGMLTTRLGLDGNYNLAYGIDGQFRVTGDEYLTLKIARTNENMSDNRITDLSPSRILLQWERRNIKGFSYDALYTYSGENFNPGIGLELRDNYQAFRGQLKYGWLPGEGKVLRYHQISLAGINITNTKTGLQETTNGTLKWYYEAKKGFSGDFTGNWYREDLADTLKLGNDQAQILPGRYDFSSVKGQFNTSGSHALSANVSADAGSFFDGWKISLSAGPKINIGTGLNLELTYGYDYVYFPERASSFTNHIAGMRGLLTVTTKTSLSAYIQYNSAISKFVTNIRFRWNPREGNDFYIVYNEGMNSALTREIPSLPYSAGRTILLKYTYTFKF